MHLSKYLNGKKIIASEVGIPNYVASNISVVEVAQMMVNLFMFYNTPKFTLHSS